MRKIMRWFAVPGALAVGAAIAVTQVPVAQAAIAPPEMVRIDGGDSDIATAIAADTAGNAYVGGAISTAINSPGQFSVVKLNAQGAIVWRANYSGNDGNLSQPTAVAIDSTGNVYAVGFIRAGIQRDSLLVKFSSSGQQLWARRTPAGPLYSRVAVGADGGIYAAGATQGGDPIIQRFDAQGTLQWTRLSPTTATFELFGDIAVAPNGNVVVSNSLNNNGDGITFDYDTTVYNPQGAVVWRRSFSVNNASHEVVADIAVDSANRVVVTGTTATSANPETEGLITRGFTVRYDASGTLLQTLESGSTAVTIDPADNVYLVGLTRFDTPATITKLDASGAVIYTNPIASDPGGQSTVMSAAVDSLGRVTVASRLIQGGFNFDFLTIRYAPNGQELGRHRIDGAPNFVDERVRVVVDAFDVALVTATSPGTNFDDIVTLRFTAGGAAPSPTTPGSPTPGPTQSPSASPTPTSTPSGTPTPSPTKPTATPAGPSAPTTLSARAVSRSRIDLAWQDNANNETGFRIERCQGTGCTNFRLVTTVGANVTSFRDTNLSRSTSYTYRIQAVNAAGVSAFSNTARATTPRF